MNDPEVRDINSSKPFKKKALEYLNKGWNPIPLPPHEKHPPPIGFTGKNAETVTQDTVAEWLSTDMQIKGKKPVPHARCNIGIHLDRIEFEDEDGNVEPWEVIGLDVDIDDHGKSGDETLAATAEDLGPLPDTFMSSAHGPGTKAGIRFYLAPAGLKWTEKAFRGSSVDIIQKAHRYAVVAPSYHPNAGQYSWYFTEDDASHAGQVAVEIPDVADLTELPEAWVDSLTRGRIEDTGKNLDMNFNTDQIERWLKSHIHGKKPCHFVKKVLTDFEESSHADIHTNMRDAQFALVNAAVEGHQGVGTALRQLKRMIHERNDERSQDNATGGIDLGDGRKQKLTERSRAEIDGEWNRAYWNAIRQVKAAVDEGEKLPQETCACFSIDRKEMVERFQANVEQDFNPAKYRYTDDGNAEMFQDLYGKNIRYTPENDQWYILSDGRWEPDRDLEIYRMFHGVRDIWLEQERSLFRFASTLPNGDEKKSAIAKAKECHKHADNCGGANAGPRCLTSLSRYEGISVPLHDADTEPNLLGCQNGILELNRDGSVKLRPYERQFFITKSTAVDYTPWSEIEELFAEYQDNPKVASRSTKSARLIRGVELLQDYFKRFIPDRDVRDFVQKVLGSSLYGGNESKLMFFFNGPGDTGKSTLVNLLQGAMGTYGAAGQLEVFDPKSGSGDRNPAMISLLGTRLVNMAEMGSSTTVNSDRMKKLASSDTVVARDNYAKSYDAVEFKPTMTFICPANGVPYVDNPDEATGNRVCCVPFLEQIKEQDKIAGRAAEMESVCREVLFSWAVEGWRSFCESPLDKKLQWPDAVTVATEDFKRSMSPTGEFEKDMIETTMDEDDVIPKNHLYKIYTQWSREAAEQMPIPKTKFGKMMSENLSEKRVSFGYHGDKQLKINCYSGVRFTRLADIKENDNVINHEIQSQKNKIDGHEAVNFKTKTK